ncbi:MAG: DNA repair protein RecN, partial [Erysipelotrichaceae bacterium]|nr:DNA repair protein RecN [Erysipelotrichaceae bacterium]
DKQIEEAYKIYRDKANELSKIRHSNARNLETDIVKELGDLMLNNAQFIVSIEEKEDSPKGFDDVEFLISTNVGQQPRQLIKVASGGEISRLMLGLKTVFTKLMGIKTVIFDEIDVGVSGKAATAIGLKMLSLSKDAMVISITHSAQVAALADHHYYVEKSNDEINTSSSIRLLGYEERVNELAIMQSSIINDTSIQAAKQLLDRKNEA